MLIQCCICGRVYKRNKSKVKFSPDDRLIWGCLRCYKGNPNNNKDIEYYKCLEKEKGYLKYP